MSNLNNCQTCEYKHIKASDDTGAGWCYMFRDEPTTICHQHTIRQDIARGLEKTIDLLRRLGYDDRIKWRE